MDGKILKIHPSINYSLVPNQDVAEYEAMGYCHVMMKVPNKAELSKLTKQERAVLKLLLQGLSPKEIATELGIDEGNTRTILLKLRAKFKCSTNLRLALEIKRRGLDIFLS